MLLARANEVIPAVHSCIWPRALPRFRPCRTLQ